MHYKFAKYFKKSSERVLPKADPQYGQMNKRYKHEQEAPGFLMIPFN